MSEITQTRRLPADIVQTCMRKRLAFVVKLVAILRTMKEYDVLITADIRTLQLVAMFRRLFRINVPRHIALELMLDEESHSLRYRVKKLLQHYIFSSIDMVFVSSSSEVRTYSERLRMRPERLRFLHFHTNIVEPTTICTSDGYILSAGRTGRDYAALAEAARGLSFRFVVVADEKSARGIDFPANIELRANIGYEEYIALLKQCSLVVVPLKRLVKSTGQVVILEAMALGKPVIATNTVGTRDYIQDDVNGMLVPPESPDALRGAIRRLKTDTALQDRISRNGLSFVNEHCTFEKYVTTVLSAAAELASSRN